MSDEQFIFILKAKFKTYFVQNDEGKTQSVGEDIKQLVQQFRQEIEDDVLQFKYREPKKKKCKW